MKKQIPLNPAEITELQKQFFHSLKLGTGRAMLLMKAHPQIDFSAQILAATVNNLAYDRQCEGSRAVYLYSLVMRSRQKDELIRTIIKKFSAKKRNDYGMDQLSDLVLYFHQAGIAGAKEALLSRFEKTFSNGYELFARGVLLEIEGMAGLIMAAEKVGQLPEQERADYEDRWRVDDFQEMNKSVDVYAELAKAAETNPAIKNYLDLILSAEPREKYRRSKTIPYAVTEIEELIDEAGRFPRFWASRISGMTQADIEQVARNFLAEKDGNRKYKYLPFFYQTKFPFDYGFLLKLASGRNVKKNRRIMHAVNALSHFKGDDIRALAFKKFASEKTPWDYSKLLVNNYKTGDAAILLEIIQRSKNFHHIHDLVAGIIDIFEANPTVECKASLEALYYGMNCAMHRWSVIDLLNKNGVLSEEIVDELAYDTDEDLRKLSRSIKRARSKMKS
ncbi:hypothetical protein ACO0LL_26655 [Undibacterium sp. TC4M20W]|uniref:hypothetical protein n=1 Tax=Undibacterium sp. TC4M20W TaxID=3413052 RepID=UPI003BF07D41